MVLGEVLTGKRYRGHEECEEKEELSGAKGNHYREWIEYDKSQVQEKPRRSTKPMIQKTGPTLQGRRAYICLRILQRQSRVTFANA